MSRRLLSSHDLNSRRGFLAGLLAALPLVPACQGFEVDLWQPPTAPPEAFEVERLRDVRYHHGPDSSPYHRLDVYLPRGAVDFPVALLVHGGAWMLGDKHEWGLYASVGQFLARHGIAAVLPNYRLSPTVRHPRHVKDIARALAWTHDQIAGLGGRPDEIFLVGHSAGGHLVSLLATHPDYIKAAHVDLACVRGVISVSGVYRIPIGPIDVHFGGATLDAFRPAQLFPVRGGSCSGGWLRSVVPGVPMQVNIYGPAFGDDPRARCDASPIEHVHAGLPPFLLVNAENDLPTLPEMAGDFQQALTAHGVECERRCIERRNHTSVFLSAVSSRDPLGAAMLDFIGRHRKPPRAG